MKKNSKKSYVALIKRSARKQVIPVAKVKSSAKLYSRKRKPADE